MSVPLADVTTSRDNNFNLLRFVAAALVLLSHCYPLTGIPHDPLRFCELSFGALAVDVFFVTSGFLVTRSLMNGRGLGPFLVNRVLRIYPGLVAAVLLCALALGAAFTTLPAAEYLAQGRTWRFVATNLAMVGPAQQFDLPGVFAGNPYPSVVNGSLWTLPWEMKMYAVLAVLGSLVFVRPPVVSERAFRAGLGLLCVGATVACLYRIRQSGSVPTEGVRFVSTFFMGACLYAFRDRVVLSSRVALILAGILAYFVWKRQIPAFLMAYCLSVGYLVLYLAYVPGGVLRLYNRAGDYSYGTYIYAFPVQQAVAASFPGIGRFAMFFVAMALTLLCAAVSWHAVEKPCLGLKRKAA